MRVLLDGTPMLGQRTGVGHYTAALAEELASRDDVEMRAVAFTLRGWRKLRSVLPHEVWARGLPVSARLLRRCWLRGRIPPIELFAGFTDVVHGTNFVLPPAVRAGGVLTVHDLAFFDHPDDLPPGDANLPELLKVSAKRAAVICTPTAAVAAAVTERLGVPEDRLVVTPLGVDPAWFAARPPTEELRTRLGLPKEYLLHVGDHGPRKGIGRLLAAHTAHGDLPPLVLAGPDTNRLAGATDRVIRTGYLSDVDLRSVVAGAAVLVLPSRDEGFGLPVLEALACNVPVVCSDVPALREVTAGHATLVPMSGDGPDVETLGATIADALADPPSWPTLTARRTHVAEFTWRRCAELTVQAYRMAAR